MSRSFAGQLRRGYLLSRAGRRFLREVQCIITTGTLSWSAPTSGHAAISTLNADEENATAQAVLLDARADLASVTFLSPDPHVSQEGVLRAARRLGLPAPTKVRFHRSSFLSLLTEYRLACETYSTHVLLPGLDRSGRRRHVHLTHGSGPKPDSTFRSPTNVLASITPQWVTQQLKEYGLPDDTEVITYMPRLEIMRHSVGDETIVEKLGLSPGLGLVVWAPTYRVTLRGREARTSGVPLSEQASAEQQDPFQIVKAIAESRRASLVLKVHPHDRDDYSGFDCVVLTNESLRARDVTPYELFGAADLLITDYSSVGVERRYLGLETFELRLDEGDFAKSYRGLRSSLDD